MGPKPETSLPGETSKANRPLGSQCDSERSSDWADDTSWGAEESVSKTILSVDDEAGLEQLTAPRVGAVTILTRSEDATKTSELQEEPLFLASEVAWAHGCENSSQVIRDACASLLPQGYSLERLELELALDPVDHQDPPHSFAPPHPQILIQNQRHSVLNRYTLQESDLDKLPPQSILVAHPGTAFPGTDNSRRLMVLAPPLNHFEAIQALKLMHSGTHFIKITHQGIPHVRRFLLMPNDHALLWITPQKPLKDSCVLLRDIDEICLGQLTTVFKRASVERLEELSFSIVYEHRTKTLDLVALCPKDFDLWLIGLKALLAHGNKWKVSKSDLTSHCFKERNETLPKAGSDVPPQILLDKLKLPVRDLTELSADLGRLVQRLERAASLHIASPSDDFVLNDQYIKLREICTERLRNAVDGIRDLRRQQLGNHSAIRLKPKMNYAATVNGAIDKFWRLWECLAATESSSEALNTIQKLLWYSQLDIENIEDIVRLAGGEKWGYACGPQLEKLGQQMQSCKNSLIEQLILRGSGLFESCSLSLTSD